MASNLTHARRLVECLSRLLPYLNHKEVALTGSVGLRINLAGASFRENQPDEVSDVDFVAAGLEAISPRVTNEVLVSHYHKPQPGYPKFMVQLVDPLSRLRVDIFPDLVGSLERARRFEIAGHRVLVLACDDIFEHKCAILSNACRVRPADVKHYRDALALAQILHRKAPSVTAECLGKATYSTDVTARCVRCELSLDPAFPLAPRRRIFKLLGYV